MDDLISRQEAIDALNKKRIETMEKGQDVNLIWECLDAVAQVPSAQKWIPCSERLPEKPKNYPHCEIRRTWFLVSLESGCVESLAYDFDRDEWQVTGSTVLAWMPLPKPYKKGYSNEQIH